MKKKQITIFYNNIYTIEVDLKSTGKIYSVSLVCDVDSYGNVNVSDVTALTNLPIE